ncbi:MAG: GNAT family N-acetyltransferase [Actinobacteria bacterium]|nr:MAG: GNAT family N-acetyltransferase [Actinomycetota bacterium]
MEDGHRGRTGRRDRDGLQWLVRGDRVGLVAPRRESFVERWIDYNDPRLSALTAFPTSRAAVGGPFKPPVAREHREALWDAVDAGRIHAFDLHVTDDGRFVGEAGLSGIEWPHASAEIAVCVFDPAERARGYGGEAVVLMLAYGFDALGLARMFIRYLSVNEAVVGAAARVAGVIGGRLVGVEREAEWAFGARRDRMIMECVREDFPPHPATAHLRSGAAG